MAYSNKEIEISAFINLDRNQIKSASLFYKPTLNQNYIELSMHNTYDSNFKVKIDISSLQVNSLDYFIFFEKKDGSASSFPYREPMENPLTIEIQPAQEEHNKGENEVVNVLEASNITILSPQHNQDIFLDDFFVSVSYYQVIDIDSSQTKLFINDIDVSKDIKKFSNHIIFNSNKFSGQCSAKLVIYNVLGQPYDPIKWNFNIISSKVSEDVNKIFTSNGLISSNYRNNTISNKFSESYDIDFKYILDFNWMQIDAKIKYDSFDKYNQYEQPKSIYSASFKGDLFKIDFGNFYPSLNKYSLNGNKVYGLGFQFYSNYFGLNIVKGNLLRANEGDPLNSMILLAEDITDSSMTIKRTNYTFEREISGIDVNFNYNQKIKWGFNIIKVIDDIRSLPIKNNNAQIKLPQYVDIIDPNFFSQDSIMSVYSFSKTFKNLYNLDTLIIAEKNWHGSTPSDNIIIGSDFKIKLDENKFIFYSGWAFSLINQDIWDPILTAAMLDTLGEGGDSNTEPELDGMMMGQEIPEDLDLVRYKNFFHFGLNQIPLIPIDLSQGSPGLYEFLNMPSVAYDFGVDLNYLNQKITVQYKQVGPQFYSLANPYLKKNFKEWLLSDRFSLIDKKLFFNMKYIYSNDGFSSTDKIITYHNKYNVNIGFYPGAGLPTFNFNWGIGYKNNGQNMAKITYNDNEGQQLFPEDSQTTQYSIAFSNQIKSYGTHTLSFNFFQSYLVDNIALDAFYTTRGYISKRNSNSSTSFSNELNNK